MNKKVSILLLSLFGFAAINAAKTQVPVVKPTIGYTDLAKSAAISTGSFVKNHALITGGVALGGLGCYLGYKKFVSKPADSTAAPKETWTAYAKRNWVKLAVGIPVALLALYVAHHYGLPSKTWRSMTAAGSAIGYVANSKIGRTVIGAATSTATAFGFDNFVNKDVKKVVDTSATASHETAPQHSQESVESTPVNTDAPVIVWTQDDAKYLKAFAAHPTGNPAELARLRTKKAAYDKQEARA